MTTGLGDENRSQRRAGRAVRWPAEWEPHQCAWLVWPQNTKTWGDSIQAARRDWAALAGAIAEREPCRLLVNDEKTSNQVSRFFADFPPGRLRLHVVPTDDCWIRDTAGVVVERGRGQRLLLDWRFDSWGGRYAPWDKDDAVAASMARILGVEARTIPVVLEGGSIDGNGRGLLLTTTDCLVHRRRNPPLDRGDWESLLAETLGIREVLWLRGGLAGDDTGGHVDNLARFTGPAAVACAVEGHTGDPNYRPLRQNLEILEGHCGRLGLDLHEIPMPAPVEVKGLRTPASYLNFFCTAGAVLVPAFGQPADDRAGYLLEVAFGGREIVPLPCRELSFGQGGLHCLSAHTPAAP